MRFYTALFAPDFQPKEQPASTDRTDLELDQLAHTLGLPQSVSNFISSRQRVTTAKNQAANAEASLKRLMGTILVPRIFEATREVSIRKHRLD